VNELNYLDGWYSKFGIDNPKPGRGMGESACAKTGFKNN